MDHNNIVKKSCLRTSKTNYCRVQFIDDDNPLDHAGITPPASPTNCSYHHDNDTSLTQGKPAIVTSSENQTMYEPLYKKEKKKTELLELQIQHLQLQLMDRDRRLALNNNDDYKYSKVSRLVNEILSLSRTDDDNQVNQHPIVSSSPSPEPKQPKPKKRQCPSTLENIHDRLQHILFNLMVTQQQQTRLQYNSHDDYQQHTTSVYY